MKPYLQKEVIDISVPLENISKRLLSKMKKWPLGNPIFADPRYYPSRLTLSNFHKFRISQDAERICYVDGGNSTIIDSPGLVVNLNRVGFCIYEGGEKIEPESLQPRVDFFTIASATYDKDEVKYGVELVPLQKTALEVLPEEGDLVFDSFDPSLMEGRRRASLSRVAAVSRAFAEWKLASEAVERELDTGDMLVRDGSLQTQITGESRYSNMAYDKAVSKDVLFTGLAKTSTLFTDTGMPLFSSIAIMANRNGLEEERWYYYPIVDIRAPDHRAYMFAVKLHPMSKYVFRFELLKEQAEKIGDFSEVISGIAQNSNDLTFPGYPYGLIEADRITRVRDEEVEPIRIQLLSAVSGLGVWDEIKAFIRTVDAHQVMDEI